ncbi:MAG: DUF1566 domain-containing protein [Oligoflexia bacterium]|nr:DUF1566 domain-containing protein [Oligoflexia bacterium]
MNSKSPSLMNAFLWPLLALALAVSGCKPGVNVGDETESASGQTSGELVSLSPAPSPSPTPALGGTSLKRVRILPGGTGTATPVGATALNVGQSLSLRGALFDMSGNYLSDIDLAWSLGSAVFPAGNLSASGSSSVSATFTPSTIGTTVIQAFYTGSDPDVVFSASSTGTITVSSPQVATSLQLVSGDAQSGTVNNNLASELKVKILDAYGQPMQGTGVTFSVTQGNGAIVGTNPVLTDASGIASMLVKLGTVSGANAHRYRATSVANGALTADFSATAIAGAAAAIEFTTQPAGAFALTPLTTQPVIRLLDAYGNVASASGTATLTTQTGTGTVSNGTATISGGIATFSNVSYSIAEAGVVLRVSDGSLYASSAAFTVSSLPPGACQRNDSFFTTADGGCKDLATGLVWSAESANVMQWHAVVWDAQTTGVPADADDAGRSNDYAEPEGCSYGCDGSATNYCHSLGEGAKTDWRAATVAELDEVTTHSMAGGYAYLAGITSELLWSSSLFGSNDAYLINMVSGAVQTQPKDWGFRTICVRSTSPRTAPTKLTVVSGTSSIGINTSGASITVRVNDASDNSVNAGGRTVTLSTNVGALSGTVTSTTDNTGKATFNAFTLDTPGTATLTFSTPGLSGTSHTLLVGAFPNTCKAPDSRYQTLEGGCKDTLTHKVWSRPAGALMTWHQAVWDSALAGNSPPDAGDGARTDDYASPHGGVPDSSTVNYCHELSEGGYTDWRLPSADELQAIANFGAGAALQFPFDTNRAFWSASTAGYAPEAATVHLGTGAGAGISKTYTNSVLCVRQGS